MLIYGPVPSRRLGQSLGINHIPPKKCSYSCVYCQIGRTRSMRTERREFFKTDEIVRQTGEKLMQLRADGETVDYLSFVPDGEPTLDIRLGQHIRALKRFGIKTAVITNGSLLWRDDVKEDLMQADWVSVKTDAADGRVWKTIDRPHGKLCFETVMQGVLDFAKVFKGTIAAETMLVGGLNDSREHVGRLADHLKRMKPSTAYLLVPTRPTVEASAVRPSPASVRDAYDILRRRGIHAECIIGAEADTFYFSDDFVNDLLSISSVHPLREDVLKKQAEERCIEWSVVERLVEKNLLIVCDFEGNRFYKRNI